MEHSFCDGPRPMGVMRATTGREERGSCVPGLMCHNTLVASMVVYRQHPWDVQSVRREKREMHGSPFNVC